MVESPEFDEVFDFFTDSAAFGSIGHAVVSREIFYRIWLFQFHAGFTENGNHTLVVTGEILGKLVRACVAVLLDKLKTIVNASAVRC